MKKVLLFLLTLNFFGTIYAQQGKDGTPSITTTTIVNIYTPLTANANVGSASITVGSTTGFSAGDLIYIVQMQGAKVKATVYQFGNPNDATPNDTSFGKIITYNGAGNNQFAEINSVSGNIITLNCALTDSFGVNGKTQIIRVPRYVSLTLSGAGQITCATWNGATGGIAVVEVQGNTIINGTSVDVSAKGFRGGAVFNASGNSATNIGSNFGTSSSNDGAHKGESIAGDTNVYKQINYVGFYSSSPLTICKGNVANGGGGGDANNCGGGGGSNGGIINQWTGMGNADNSTPNNTLSWSQESTTAVNGSFRPTTSSGGGRGGYAFSGNNADPTTNGPNNNGVWAGDSRHNDGGWGGIPLDYIPGKLFLGGGGGAGDSNDGNGTSGGAGGGMFYLLSYGTVSGSGQILANGETAINTDWNNGIGKVGDDGAGGGGGGGTVIINSTGNILLTNTLSVSAQGGGGGSFKRHGLASSQVFGPGGGGGGGYVTTTNTITGVNTNGGANGIAVNGGGDNTKISTKFPPNGATSGGIGTTTTSTAPFYLTATNYTTCTSSAVSLSVTVNGTTPSGLSVVWYTVATGGTSVFSGNPYSITAPSTAGTYTYYAGTCPGTYRIPIILTVNSAGAPTLTISATNTTVCLGTPVTLTVSGAMNYTWSANAGSATTNTVSVSPTGNTTYSVTGVTTGACAGTATTSITINTTSPPTITITPTSYTLCSGATATLTANSSATSYTWSSNAGSATTNTVTVSPTSNTTYTVTGGSGTCTASQTIVINVTTTPTLVVTPSNTYICSGTSATFTANGATTYSWSTGALTNTVSVSPTSNTTYTAIGYNGTCMDMKTVFVKVDNGIKKADSTLTSASCGQANGAYVINSVTGGISPYQINFNGTGFTAISAFSYSVNNITGNIYPVILKDSLGCTYTTSVTIGNTSGITGIDSTIQNANCVPANSGAINIVSITGGTAPYQTNINGGSFNPITTFPYTFNNLIAGTYTILVKDGTNCPHTSYITVDSNTGVTSANITPISDTCNRQVGEINVTQIVGGVSPYSVALNNGSYQTATTFTGLPASTTDTVKIKDANGCVYIAPNATVTNTGSATTPTITAIGSATVCQGNSVTLTSSSAASYTWSTGANTQTITVNSSATYSVAITSVNGCSANSNAIIVTINAIPHAPVVNDTTINECSVQPIQFNYATGTLVVQNSVGQSQTLPFTPTVSGTYTAYDSANGCQSAVKNITVNITATPTVAPTSSTAIQYCIGTQASALTATTTVSGASLVWQDANHNTIITPPNPTPTTNNLGVTTYYVYQTIGACASPTTAILVTVVPTPNPNFTIAPATDISVGQSVVFTPAQTSTVSGTYSYAWDFGDITNPTAGSILPMPSYTYNTAGFYCVRLTITNTQTTCSASIPNCLDILANISMVIPNIFTPNGDGINDVFSIKANGFTNLTCDIFDRWGLKLYTFNGASGYWDGAKAVDGTYFYVIQSTDVKGEDHKYNGFIQLIK